MAGKVELLNRLVTKFKEQDPNYNYRTLSGFLDRLSDEIGELLKEGENVTIKGLGRFKKSMRKFELVGKRKDWKISEEGKKRMEAGPRPYVSFKASGVFKKRLQEN